MTSLFGISMDTIMAWMLAIFLVITVVVAALAVVNRLFFKLGLRNIPRRRAQTILIFIGLMLSTVIVTSAFSTGDTVSYTIRSATITNLGNIDESVTASGGRLGQFGGGGGGGGGGLVAATYVPPAVQQRILTAQSGNKNVDGVTGVVARNVPLQDLTSGQTKNQNVLAGIPTNYPAAFGPLTTNSGTPVTMSQLGANEVYLNQVAADNLNAHPGDTLQTFVGTSPVRMTVRAVLKSEYLASGGLLSNGETSDPTVILPLARAQQLLGQPGAVSMMLISNRGNDTGGYSLSDGVTNQLRALLANNTEVATVKGLLAGNDGKAALATLIHDKSGTTKTKLEQLQTQVALPGVSDSLRSLLSDTDVSDPLSSMKAPAQVSAPLNDALASISAYHVEPLKKNGLDAADLFGSFFTTFFVAFSLFSIAAGIMLIFLIFTMLAAERRPEMGMARAVGTKRRHLIQMFLFEGYVYDLGAALVGLVLGIGVGLGMVRIMSALLSGVSDNFTLVGHVEPRSLVVSFCLGALVTFLTVAFASYRVSRLNVVAAIRDLPESFGVKTDVGHAWFQTRQEFARIFDRKHRSRLIFWGLGIVLLVVPQLTVLGIVYLVARLGWYLRHLFGAFVSRGWLFLLVGVPLVPVGISTGQEIFFGLGGSFIVIGVAMLIRWILHFQHVDDAVRNRIGYSLAGIGLVVYWLLPFDFWNSLGVPSLNAGPEMFFVAGILLVIGAVWTVMYNVDVILGGLLAVFGRAGQLAPVIKMAVSYPMQHKFRTGLTLAMFSLVIFTLMFMSAIVGSTSSSLSMDRDTGGYQTFGAANPNNPIQGGVQHAIAGNPALKDITATGGIAKLDVGLRQPGKQDQSWNPYIANVVDDSYLSSTQFTLHARADGYGSDAQVWQTLRTKPGFAVVDGNVVLDQPGGQGQSDGFAIDGAYYEHATFSPVTIEMRDTNTGAIFKLTVIGVLDQRAANLQALTEGVYTGENTLTAAGSPVAPPNFFVFRVSPGANVHTIALALGKTFLQNGLDVKESQKQFDTNQAVSIGLFDLLEGFMGLGLVVGIAALGVVATRAVVERRQEIGMMRAIGFRRTMIRTTFLLESSFVAILGTLLGVGLGLRVAENLIDQIAKTNNSISFTVPWLQILVIVVIAYIASLITTYMPAWQASRVYPAEALRYE